MSAGEVVTAVVMRTDADASRPPSGAEMVAARHLMGKYREVRNFKNARKLLIEAGVPFEPNLLLEHGWREQLGPRIREMRRMRGRVHHSGRLNGVELAEVLYLPANVTVEGETVILARSLRFQGDQVKIRGNHPVHIFILEDVGAADGNATITLDTSGVGREEWLATQTRQLGSESDPRSRALWTLATQNASGNPGADGVHGRPGSAGAPGADGIDGPDGRCGGDLDGRSGLPGHEGGPGGRGEDGGGAGQRGGDAQPITVSIPPNDTNTWFLKAKGGDGGMGGFGGDGGPGGAGGKGGRGGDGAACPAPQPCRLGKGGDGGRGGKGGKGGDGGNGKRGGDGGNGAAVTVTFQVGFDVDRLEVDARAGRGGDGGGAGRGFPALYYGGTGGQQGKGGSWFSCGTSNDGMAGSVGDVGAHGIDGTSGNSGAHGDPGSLTLTGASGPYAPPEAIVPPKKDAACVAGSHLIEWVSADGGRTWREAARELLWCTTWR